MTDTVDGQLAQHGAQAIRIAFEVYHARFKEITRRARSRFEAQDWHAAHHDALERLDLYKEVIDHIVADVKLILGSQSRDRSVWIQMKGEYTRLIAGRGDFELAETFFNSVTRRIFDTVGVDPNIEYVDSDFEAPWDEAANCVCQAYALQGSLQDLVGTILQDYAFEVDYQDAGLDAGLVAGEIEARLQELGPNQAVEMIEMATPVFYRGKGAYLIGRIRAGSHIIPLVMALLNTPQGIVVDAVLLTEDEVSIVFSFTRSYFHVEVERPYELIHFCKSLLPRKRVAELYISIGYNKHGKTMLYRDLLQHLAESDDKFVIAEGARGMVMTVFTMPSYDIVFKIIRDQFAYPKHTTRRAVEDKYQLVFKHDRAGRLVDAQEFEHLRFDRNRFSADLVEELVQGAGRTVQVEGDQIVIQHLYMERRMTPLDVYVRQAGEDAACDAIVDYGTAIKDLAATNIFPGDLLLKNFGVTRHGRVVFYDYDELCFLTDCTFREIPDAPEGELELVESWFAPGDNDIFPQEMIKFMGLQGRPREAFLEAHADLLGVEFWAQMQARHLAGEVMDVFPYRQSKRLARL